MPRYFFDVQNGGPTKDDTGHEFDTLDEACQQAVQTLADVARGDIPSGADRQTLTILVSDENGTPVYVATMNFTGMSLHR